MKGDTRMNDKGPAAGSNCRLSIESCNIHSITLNACMGCVKRPEEAFLPSGSFVTKQSQKKLLAVVTTTPECLENMSGMSPKACSLTCSSCIGVVSCHPRHLEYSFAWMRLKMHRGYHRTAVICT